MKIKLRDMTYNQYRRWKEENCSYKTCKKCVFNRIACGYANKDVCWVNNKNVYSNEFLNQEVAIGKEQILTEEEHKYLLGIIGSLEKIVVSIKKTNPKIWDMWGEVILIKFEDNSLYVTSTFELDEYFKAMELNKEYTPEELGL